MIILIKGFIETINYFIDCMAQGRDDVIILDTTEPEIMFQTIADYDRYINESAVVVTFNNFGVYLNTDQGNYWEQKGVKVYNIYLDHPINYTDEIEASFRNLKFLMVDMYHAEFVKENWPDIADQISFLPHGGRDLGYYKRADRELEALYVGSCQPENTDYPCIDFLSGKETEFYKFCYQVYMQELYFQVDNVVDVYIAQSGRSFTPAQRMEMISAVSMTVERRVMHDLKYALLGAAAEAGIQIQIHGNGWESLKANYPEYITIGPILSSEECIHQMGRARIVFNMQPFFTYGGHDRIFNGMLNGAVCVSCQSRYLEARFSHGRDIIFADFANLHKTAEEIKQIVEEKELFLQIRQNAYHKVWHDTWQFRLQQIIKEQP